MAPGVSLDREFFGAKGDLVMPIPIIPSRDRWIVSVEILTIGSARPAPPAWACREVPGPDL